MSTMNFVSGRTDGSYVRVGHNSGSTNPDAVWSFAIGDSSMASINTITISYNWNNAAAGSGWSNTYTYICRLYASDNATQIAAPTVSLGGASGSGTVNIGGLSLTPGQTYYIHWNQNGSTLSTMKEFQQGAQGVDIVAYTAANSAPYWNAGSTVSVSPSGLISSDTTQLTVSWSGGADVQNNHFYDVYRVSSLGNVLLADNTTATSITDTIGAGNEGATYRYDVYIYDSYGLSGGGISSATVTKNTKPTWSGSTVSVDGYTAAKTIPENDSSLTVSWSAANSNNGGQSVVYNVYRGETLIAASTTATFVTDNIGSGNQGVSYQYGIQAYDGIQFADTVLYSPVIIKNTLTAATLSSATAPDFNSAAIAFTWSGANNTDGSSSFTYKLSGADITVYNSDIAVSTPYNMPIYRTGTVPTTPYIKFDDVKNKFAGSSYNGTLTFILTTANAYGSSKTTAETVNVDIRTYPSAIASITPSGTYTIGGTGYYIPDRKAITLIWTASTDPLGTAVTYDVQASLAGGAYTTIKSGLTTNTSTVTFAKVSAATSCVFKVVAKTAYGYTTSNSAASITLHYYTQPTIAINDMTRTETGVTVVGAITANSSIAAAKTISTLTYTGVSGSAVAMTASYTPSKTETLTAYDAYTFTFTVQDLGGVAVGTAAQSASIEVSTYVPMFSIREKGVGVNAIVEDDGYFLKVGGKANFISDGLGNKGLYIDGVNIIDVIYPVGALYLSAVSTSPAALFGGTWVAIQDKFILSAGSTYAAGSTGGAATVALTEANLATHTHTASAGNQTANHTHNFTVTSGAGGAHTHGIGFNGDAAAGSGRNRIAGTDKAGTANDIIIGVGDHTHAVSGVTAGISANHSHAIAVNNAGSGTPHNNLPPYLAVYVWKRTA